MGHHGAFVTILVLCLSARAVLGCEDDAEFKHNNKRGKDCDWVAKKSSKTLRTGDRQRELPSHLRQLSLRGRLGILAPQWKRLHLGCREFEQEVRQVPLRPKKLPGNMRHLSNSGSHTSSNPGSLRGRPGIQAQQRQEKGLRLGRQEEF